MDSEQSGTSATRDLLSLDVGINRPRGASLPAGVSELARGTAIHLTGVSRVFGLDPALVRVDLRVEMGQTVLVHGPNGAGKTTLLKTIATLLAPTYGRGSVLGFDIERERREIRRRIEFLGHRTRFYADLTATENLRFAAALSGIRDPRLVSDALERAELTDRAGARVEGFSQGMRQRLALARAFVRCPELLLLDEPYAGLDEAGKALVDALILEVGRDHAVILATHDVGRAELLADRRIQMERGRILFDHAMTVPGGIP